MSINQASVAGKPTFMRADVRVNCVNILSWTTGAWTPSNRFAYSFDPHTGSYTLELVDPSNYEEGTMFFSKEPDYPSGRLYVVVIDPTTLNKKIVPASASVFYNSTTSKLLDPLAVFYDPLAS